MRGCELQITTESGGEVSLFRTEALFEDCGAAEKVRYSIDNDDAELTYGKAFFENRRCGTCGLRAKFMKGGDSGIILETSSFRGKIPVKTVRYRLEKSETERNIELIYDMIGKETIQTFHLKIQIKFFSEEK